MTKIKDKLHEIISNISKDINSTINFNNLGYLPRWLILMIDVFIISSTWGLSYYLLSGLKLQFTPRKYLIIAPAIYLFLNIFFFWLFRTYSGIIRHSSYTDALKLFFSQFS